MLFPVPAVMLSCGRENEKPNIITLAWAGNVCSDPPMVSVSIRRSRYSYDIIKETGEFVLNLTTESLARKADLCGVKSGRDIDKFETVHLTPQPSKKIKAPGIMESPVNIECKVEQIIPLGTHDLFLAKVLGVSVDESLLNKKGTLDLKRANLVAWSHGEYMGLGKKIGKFGYSVQKRKTGKR